MPDISSILILCINLPAATERRAAVEEQARRLGLEVQFVEAVAGKDLPENPPAYDRKGRAKIYTYDLSPNEIACTLSHIKAMETFLASGADYAVIMEDDIVFADNIKEGLHELIHDLHGWEAAKIYTADDAGRLYDLGDKGKHVSAVFPRKVIWGAVAWLYTRKAVEQLLPEMQPVFHAADAQIGQTLLRKQIPTIGVYPRLIATSDPNTEHSTIDTADTPRIICGRRRSLLQYLRYRLSVIRTAQGKKRMIRLMRRRLNRAQAH